LKVPGGTAELVRARLADSTPSDRAVLNWYTVKSGESLSAIARKLRVAKADLAEANYISPRSRVRPGQKLMIPRAPAVLMASTPDRSGPVAASRPAVSSTVAASTAKAEPSPQAARVVYRVKRGDTLASIARLFQTTVASLRVWNHLSSNRISAGERLTVFRPVARTAQNR
jgi:LysM repeat protein